MTKYARKGLRIARQPQTIQAPGWEPELPPYEPFPEQMSEVGEVANASSFARKTSEDMYEYLLEQRDELSTSLAVLEQGIELSKDIKKRLKIIDKTIKELAKLDEPDEAAYSYMSAGDLPEEAFNAPAKIVEPELDRLSKEFS